MDLPGGSSHTVTLGDRGWHVETIWRAALGLPVQQVPVDAIREVDEDCWFSGRPPTVREVVDHARRIADADLTVPIILASDGQVLDGMHRIAKAVLCGQTSIAAQRLTTDPDPDWLRPSGAAARTAGGSVERGGMVGGPLAERSRRRSEDV